MTLAEDASMPDDIAAAEEDYDQPEEVGGRLGELPPVPCRAVRCPAVTRGAVQSLVVLYRTYVSGTAGPPPPPSSLCNGTSIACQGVVGCWPGRQ